MQNPYFPSTASSACSDLREMNEARVNSIMSYLESVERPPSRPVAPLTASVEELPQTLQTATSSTCGSLAVVDGNQVYTGIKSKMNTLRQNLEQTQAEKAALEEKLDAQKRRETERIAQLQRVSQEELHKMKSDVQQRNLAHADSQVALAAENSHLTKSLEMLNQQLSWAKKEHGAELKKLEDAHAAAMSSLKAKWMAQEKVKREQWAAKEAKKIKEATLKAMEPDIAQLMHRQKAERARMSENNNDILRLKDEQIRAKDVEMEALRSQTAEQYRDLLQKERDACQKRIAELTERNDVQLEEAARTHRAQKKSAEEFHESQLQILRGEVKELQQQVFSLKASSTVDQQRFASSVESEVERLVKVKTEELEEKRKSLGASLEIAIAEEKEKMDKVLAQKREELVAQLTAERDAAIAKVIQRLEDEHASDAGERRKEVKQLRSTVSALEAEADRMKVDRNVKDEQLRSLKTVLEEKTRAISDLESRIGALDEDKASIVAEAEKRFEQRLRHLDCEWQRKVNTMEGDHVKRVLALEDQLQKAKHHSDRESESAAAELRGIESRHNAELSTLNDKILVTVSKKDAQIQQLQMQVGMLEGNLAARELELQRHHELLQE